MKSRRSLVVFLAVFAYVTSVPMETDASVSVAVSLDDLARSANGIARVTALDAAPRWEDGRIVTYSRVRVDDVIAGNVARGAEIDLRTLGGIVDGIGQHVEGEAHFVRGRSSIVFLTGHTGVAAVVGRAQGQLAIVKGGDGREIVRRLDAGAIVLRGPRRLLASLDGRDFESARAEIVRAWEVGHAR
jgi:hypothetical protein